MPYYTPIVTLLAIGLYFFLAMRVAVARGKFGVSLPATSGNPDFERVYRVHQNTLEWLPTFLRLERRLHELGRRIFQPYAPRRNRPPPSSGPGISASVRARGVMAGG